jgi:hypothetical protein
MLKLWDTWDANCSDDKCADELRALLDRLGVDGALMSQAFKIAYAKWSLKGLRNLAIKDAWDRQRDGGLH